jgi:ATP-dependent Lhr-like helicase
LLIEAFRDEIGDWRVVLHSPYGARVHAPWALAMARTLNDRLGIDAQVMHADDGIVVRLPDYVPTGEVTGDDSRGDSDHVLGEMADALAIEPEDIEQIVHAELTGSALADDPTVAHRCGNNASARATFCR